MIPRSMKISMPVFLKNRLKMVDEVRRRFPFFCVFWGAGSIFLWVKYSKILHLLQIRRFHQIDYLGLLCLLCAVAFYALAMTHETLNLKPKVRKIAVGVILAFFAFVYFKGSLGYFKMIGLFIAFRLWADSILFIHHPDNRLFLTYHKRLGIETVRHAFIPGAVFIALFIFMNKFATAIPGVITYLLLTSFGFAVFGLIIPLRILGNLPKNPILYARQTKSRTWIDHLNMIGMIGLLLIAALFAFYFSCAVLSDFTKGNYIWSILFLWPIGAIAYWIFAKNPRLSRLTLSLAVVSFLLSLVR